MRAHAARIARAARASRRTRAALACGGAVLLLLALLPDVAYAWTPGTHVALGDAVLSSLHLVPQNIAELLRAFPHDFLYGSIAADSSMAKKYAPVGRHCHSWHVGLEIYDRARNDEPLRAFGLGYLSHLAADSVAHNYFVPRQLAVTSSTAALGHSYWESRFETHLSERFSRRARELLLRDHGRSDAHLDRILSPTIFSTHTNRRIFRGMVVAADSESWQRVFQVLVENSRWDLDEHWVARYLERSFDFVVDLLSRFDASEPYRLDPAGDEQLRFAKRVRRTAIQRGGGTHVERQAARHFGMPKSKLEFAAKLESPLYDGLARAASS